MLDFIMTDNMKVRKENKTDIKELEIEYINATTNEGDKKKMLDINFKGLLSCTVYKKVENKRAGKKIRRSYCQVFM